MLDQQYQSDVHTFWQSSSPTPELVAALDDGWLGAPDSALDLGCGLGTELAHLARCGVALTVDVDRSTVALNRAHRQHPTVQLAPAFQAMLADLGITSTDDLLRRAEDVTRFLPTLRETAETILSTDLDASPQL